MYNKILMVLAGVLAIVLCACFYFLATHAPQSAPSVSGNRIAAASDSTKFIIRYKGKVVQEISTPREIWQCKYTDEHRTIYIDSIFVSLGEDHASK